MSDKARGKTETILGVKDVVVVRMLLLTDDFRLIDIISRLASQMLIHLEPCCDVQLAMGKLCHAKFEGIVVDLDFSGAGGFLAAVNTLTSNRTAISFAVLSKDKKPAEAFQGIANFMLERPLCPGPVLRTLQAAYPLMIREKRRYFRYPVQVEVSLARSGEPEVTVTSLNLSENGICLTSTLPMKSGDKLRLRLRLPGTAVPLNLMGEVCWSEASGRVGIQFSELTPEMANTLRGWLAERLEELVAHSYRGCEGIPALAYTGDNTGMMET